VLATSTPNSRSTTKTSFLRSTDRRAWLCPSTMYKQDSFEDFWATGPGLPQSPGMAPSSDSAVQPTNTWQPSVTKQDASKNAKVRSPSLATTTRQCVWLAKFRSELVLLLKRATMHSLNQQLVHHPKLQEDHRDTSLQFRRPQAVPHVRAPSVSGIPREIPIRCFQSSRHNISEYFSTALPLRLIVKEHQH
jgi:hypothetical protein